ncbi:MAG: hypothetical protein V4628_11660 [Pseudomonadota bacterium]
MKALYQSAQESQMHNLGIQARQADYAITACNLSLYNPLRAWWIAGWVDTDNEIKQQVKMEQAA